MNNLRQAAQQALEAMDKATGFMSDSDYKKLNEAIDTLRAALAEPEQYDQTALELCNVCGWKTLIPGDACLNCERQALAEPEQEPVAFIGTDGELGWLNKPNTLRSAATPLYTAPTPRKPLTDGQLRGFFMLTNTAEPLAEGWPGLERFARAIERAHGIGGEA